MRLENNNFSNKILSYQLKKALCLAFYEARKYNLKVVNSKLLLYAILKTNNSLAAKNLSNIYNSSSIFKNKIRNFENKFKLQLKTKAINGYENDNIELNFTKVVRKILFVLLRSLKSKKPKVITTLHVFNYLIRNRSVKSWLKESLN